MKKRLLSIALIFSMVLSLCPVGVLAAGIEDEPEETSISPQPMTLTTSGVVSPGEGECYARVGSSTIYSSTLLPLLDVEGNYVTDVPGSGVLQMVNSAGTAVASSYAIGNYAEHYDEEGNFLGYAIDFFEFPRNTESGTQDLTVLPAGSYSLQLVTESGTTYLCAGSITLLDERLVSGIHVNSGIFAPGISSFGLTVYLYGFTKDTDLAKLSLTLTDSEGATVGASTGRWRDLYLSQDGTLTATAEIQISDGAVIEPYTEYPLVLGWSGENMLYDIRSEYSRSLYPSSDLSLELDELVVTDPQTGKVSLFFSGMDSAADYRVRIYDGAFSEDISTRPVRASFEGKLPADGVLSLQLTKGGVSAPLTTLGDYFHVRVWQDGELIIGSYDGRWSNPYAYLNSRPNEGEWVSFSPSSVSPSATSLPFTMSIPASYRGKGDVLTVCLQEYEYSYDEETDQETRVLISSTEMGRCENLTEVPSKQAELGESALTGTITFTEELPQNGYLSLFLNGTELGSMLQVVSRPLVYSSAYPFVDSDDGMFFTNFGVFPVTFRTLNCTGTGTISIGTMSNESITPILSSPAITGTVGDDGLRTYRHSFTTDDLAALDGETSYYLVLETADGAYQSSKLGTYDSTVVAPDFSKYLYNDATFSLDLSGLSAGDQTLSMQLYLDRGNVRNITSSDLDGIGNLCLYNTTSDTDFNDFWIAGWAGSLNETGSRYALELEVGRPLTAGDYQIYIDSPLADGTPLFNEWGDTVTFTVSESASPSFSHMGNGETVDGSNLPADGIYTAAVYKGYTAIIDSAPLFWTSSTSLYIPNALRAGLNGEYDLRFYLNGEWLGATQYSYPANTQTVVSLTDSFGSNNALFRLTPMPDPDDPSAATNYVSALVEVVNAPSGCTRVRVAASEDGLENAEILELSNRSPVPVNFPAKAGEQTACVQLLNRYNEVLGTYTFPIYCWEEELGADGIAKKPLSVYVHENLDGFYTGSTINLTAAADIPYANLWLEAMGADGTLVNIPLNFSGKGDLPDPTAGFCDPVESEHSYANNTDAFWTRTSSDAESLLITFSEDCYLRSPDCLYIYAGEVTADTVATAEPLYTFTGTSFAGTTIVVADDTVTFRLVTNGWNTAWGFAATVIDPDPIIDDGDTTNDKYLYSTGNLGLEDYLDSNETLQLKNCSTLTFYAADETNLRLSDDVTRSVIFGSPTAIILPQFSGDTPTFRAKDMPLTFYGYATPNATVRVYKNVYDGYWYETVYYGTATADDMGYFTLTVDTSSLEEGYQSLTVSDGYFDDKSVNFWLYHQAPEVSSFTYVDNGDGTVTFHWICSDDVSSFKLLQGEGHLDWYISASDRSATYTVDVDESNPFVLIAVDSDGNEVSITATEDLEAPTAPTGLTASAVNSGAIQLAWGKSSDDSGVTAYVVYPVGEEEYDPITVDSAKLTMDNDRYTYTVCGLEMGTAYTFTVTAMDGAGNESEPSNEAGCSTPTLTVTPNGLEESYVRTDYPYGYIEVGFEVSSDLDGHEVVLSDSWLDVRPAGGGDDDWVTQNMYGDQNGYWYFSELASGAYELRFRVTEEDGASACSEIITVWLKDDASAPTVPGALTPISHTTTAISFRWDRSDDNVEVDYYSIYLDGELVNTYNVYEGDGAALLDNFSHWQDGLEPDTEYEFSVIAVDTSGNESEESTAKLRTAKLEFGDVTTLEESYVVEDHGYYNNTAVLEVEYPATDGYEFPGLSLRMEYRLSGTNDWTAVSMAKQSDGSYAASWYMIVNEEKLEYLPLGTYEVRFAMTDGNLTDGETIYSEVQTTELTGETEPPTIWAYYSYTYRGANLDELRAECSDNVAVATIDFYYAFCGNDIYSIPDPEYVLIGTVAGERYVRYYYCPWLDENGQPAAAALEDGRYAIKIVATDARGNSTTKECYCSLDNTAPDVPSGVTAAATSRYIQVQWKEDTSGETSYYNVYRRISGTETWECYEYCNYPFRDTSETAEDGVTYEYYVTAVDEVGNESGPSAIVSATFVEDTESPTITAMYPYEGIGLRRSVDLQVAAKDNYRLYQAEFYYRLHTEEGTEDWSYIGADTLSYNDDSHTFHVDWNITEFIDLPYDVQFEIRALVWDDSLLTESEGYVPNEPAELIHTVTIHPYSLPVAPAVSAEADYMKATINWTYNGLQETLVRFEIQSRSADSSMWNYVASAPAGISGSRTVDLPAKGETMFRVVALDCCGESASSDPITLESVIKDTENPVAVILPETLTAAPNVPYIFSAVNSSDNTSIVSYAWNFGDGSNPVSSDDAFVSHTYAAAGTYPVTLTVTDICGNTGSVTESMTVYDISAEGSHALVKITVLDGYSTETPAIPNASVKIFAEDALGNTVFETTGTTDSNGLFNAVAPKGKVRVAVTAGGFVATSRLVTIEPDASGVFEYTVGMAGMNVSVVDGSLTSTEMTYQEIRAAGIDVTDPDNAHVWKFEATLSFTAAPALPFDIPDRILTAFFNEKGEFVGGSGWGWSDDDDDDGVGGGSGIGYHLNIGVFPISEHFILVIYGEAHWLKEMYNVELLVINNSYLEPITECDATLVLPDGLSLAAMTGKEQTGLVNIPDIPAKTSVDDTANIAKVNWYVRGDKEGAYNLTAIVNGRCGEPFCKVFTTDKPVKVYAGSALHLTIIAEDIAYREEEYHVQFVLKNVSDKDIYNLSFGLTGADQFRVSSFFGTENKQTLSHEDFGDSMTRKIDVLKAGGSITIDFYTTIWFNSLLGLADLGPFDVGYYLNNVLVTTLEGSTTEIPCDIQIVRSSHGSFYEWLLGELFPEPDGEDIIIDAIDDYFMETFGEKAPFLSTMKKIYDFADTMSGGDAESRCDIQIENGYVTPDNNFLRSRSVQTGAIAVSTDAEKYEVSVDETTGITTLSLLSPGKVYVEGRGAGTAKLTANVYTPLEDGTKAYEQTYEVTYILTEGTADAVDAVLQTPAEGSTAAVPYEGETSQIVFPYLLIAEDGSYLSSADNTQWNVTGENTDGLTFSNGILTVESHAQGGEYTVSLTTGEKTVTQTITLTREPSIATRMELYRGDRRIGDKDTLSLDASADVIYNYSAKVLDQYGVAMVSDVVWSLHDNTCDASMADGTITLGSTGGTLTLTAGVNGTDITASVAVTVLNTGALTVNTDNVTSTGGTVTITNTTDAAVTVLGMVAVYNESGSMISCQVEPLTINAGQGHNVELSHTAEDGVSSVRIFLLNDATSTPLTAVWEHIVTP